LKINELTWLIPQQQLLLRARAGGRFPGALLIHEDAGAGGAQLARFGASLRLCREPNAPCGDCRDCRAVERSQHPDLHWIEPIEDSKLIRVEQIRELGEEMALTSHGGQATVAVIRPAEAMNAHAANALLKTLEEPRPGVTLVLVTTAPSRLPATIRSRCQRLRAASPNRAQCVAWLQAQRGEGDWNALLELIGNAPLLALDLDPAEAARLRHETVEALTQARAGQLDIPAAADRWAKDEAFELRLASIDNWLTTRIERWVGGEGQSRELRSGAHLRNSASDMNIATLLRLLEAIYELRRLALTAINRTLALEQLLWQFVAVAAQ
jgi:DNA polymerase-3 subunit delta'